MMYYANTEFMLHKYKQKSFSFLNKKDIEANKIYTPKNDIWSQQMNTPEELLRASENTYMRGWVNLHPRVENPANNQHNVIGPAEMHSWQ